ncbi:MAG: hypothetical protein IJO10_08240 [Clostridia bacterium]|nr:hypothetical protein [Clostridia bacterium]
MKRLFILLLCISLLSGCGNNAVSVHSTNHLLDDYPLDEKTLSTIIADNASIIINNNHQKMEVGSLTIESRKTENKTDYVQCTVWFENELYMAKYSYDLYLEYSDAYGWKLVDYARKPIRYLLSNSFPDCYANSDEIQTCINQYMIDTYPNVSYKLESTEGYETGCSYTFSLVPSSDQYWKCDGSITVNMRFDEQNAVFIQSVKTENGSIGWDIAGTWYGEMVYGSEVQTIRFSLKSATGQALHIGSAEITSSNSSTNYSYAKEVFDQEWPVHVLKKESPAYRGNPEPGAFMSHNSVYSPDLEELPSDCFGVSADLTGHIAGAGNWYLYFYHDKVLGFPECAEYDNITTPIVLERLW